MSSKSNEPDITKKAEKTSTNKITNVSLKGLQKWHKKIIERVGYMLLKKTSKRKNIKLKLYF